MRAMRAQVSFTNHATVKGFFLITSKLKKPFRLDPVLSCLLL